MPLFGEIVVIKRNGSDGGHFPLTATTCLFGRKAECDIRIQLAHVSKEHCKVEVKNKEVFATNLSSVNPTQLNGRAIQQPVRLQHGDVLTIIDRSFRFEEVGLKPVRRRSTGLGSENYQGLQIENFTSTDETVSSRIIKGSRKSEGVISKTTHTRRSLQISSNDKALSPFSELYEMLKSKVDSKKSPVKPAAGSPKNVRSEKAENSPQSPVSPRRASRGGQANASIAQEVHLNVVSNDASGSLKSPSRGRRSSLGKHNHDTDAVDVLKANVHLNQEISNIFKGDGEKNRTPRKSGKRSLTESPGFPFVGNDTVIRHGEKESQKQSPRRSSSAEQTLRSTSPVNSKSTPGSGSSYKKKAKNAKLPDQIIAGGDLAASPSRRLSRRSTEASPKVSDPKVESTSTGTKKSPRKRKSNELAFPGHPMKRKRVSFGGHLSPELFDKRLPPNSPLKRGATPARRSLSTILPQAVIRKSFGLRQSAIKELHEQYFVKSGRSAFIGSPTSSKMNLAGDSSTRANRSPSVTRSTSSAHGSPKSLSRTPAVSKSSKRFSLTTPVKTPPGLRVTRGIPDTTSSITSSALASSSSKFKVNSSQIIIPAALPGKKLSTQFYSAKTPAKVSPAKTPAKVSPAKTPAKVSPAKTPAKVSPAKTPAKVSPAKTPAKVSPAKTPAKVSPAKTPAKVSPAKTPAKVSPAKTPAKVSPAKRSPAKVSPAKLSPAKVSPAKRSPAKVSPAKRSPAKASPAKRTPAKASPAKRTPAKASPAKRTPAKASPAKRTPAKASPAKRTPAKASPAKRTPAKASPAKRTPAKASPAKRTPAKASPAKRTPAKASPAKRTPAKASPAKRTPAKASPAKRTPAKASPAKRTPAKASPAKRTPAKASPAKRTPAKASPAKRTPAKASPAKRTPAKASPAKRTPAKASPAKRTPAKASPAKRTPAKASPAKRTPAKASPAKRTPAKASPAKRTPAKASPAKRTPAKASPAKRTPAKASPAKRNPSKASPAKLSPAKRSMARASLAKTPTKQSPTKASPAKSNLYKASPIERTPFRRSPVMASPIVPYTKGRFSISRVKTPPQTEPVSSNNAHEMRSSQTPKPSRKSFTLKKTPGRRSRKLDALEVTRARRRTGATAANLLLARSWADVVKIGVAKPQKKNDKPASKVKIIKKTKVIKTPLKKAKHQTSTGHADSPATILVGKAHTRSVNLTGHAPKVVRNTAAKINIDLNESFTGMTELFSTPVDKKQRQSIRKTDDTGTPRSVVSEISVMKTPEESGEMVVSPMNSPLTAQRKYRKEAVSRLLRSPVSPELPKGNSQEVETTAASTVIQSETKGPEPQEAKSSSKKGKALNTRNEKRKTIDLTGIKRILKTPRQKGKPITDPVALKKMLRTPKYVESLPVVYTRKSAELDDSVGLKNLMKTPGQKGEPVQDLTGIKRIMKTPRQKGEPVEDLIGIKRIMRTPKQKVVPVEDLTGIKRIMRTPKQRGEPVEDMIGIKRMMATPKEKGQPLEDMEGISRIMSTPTENTHPIEEIFGIKQLIKTPPKKTAVVKEVLGVANHAQTGSSESTESVQTKSTKISLGSEKRRSSKNLSENVGIQKSPEPVAPADGENKTTQLRKRGRPSKSSGSSAKYNTPTALSIAQHVQEPVQASNAEKLESPKRRSRSLTNITQVSPAFATVGEFSVTTLTQVETEHSNTQLSPKTRRTSSKTLQTVVQTCIETSPLHHSTAGELISRSSQAVKKRLSLSESKEANQSVQGIKLLRESADLSTKQRSTRGKLPGTAQESIEQRDVPVKSPPAKRRGRLAKNSLVEVVAPESIVQFESPLSTSRGARTKSPKKTLRQTKSQVQLETQESNLLANSEPENSIPTKRGRFTKSRVKEVNTLTEAQSEQSTGEPAVGRRTVRNKKRVQGANDQSPEVNLSSLTETLPEESTEKHSPVGKAVVRRAGRHKKNVEEAVEQFSGFQDGKLKPAEEVSKSPPASKSAEEAQPARTRSRRQIGILEVNTQTKRSRGKTSENLGKADSGQQSASGSAANEIPARGTEVTQPARRGRLAKVNVVVPSELKERESKPLPDSSSEDVVLDEQTSNSNVTSKPLRGRRKDQSLQRTSSENENAAVEPKQIVNKRSTRGKKALPPADVLHTAIIPLRESSRTKPLLQPLNVEKSSNTTSSKTRSVQKHSLVVAQGTSSTESQESGQTEYETFSKERTRGKTRARAEKLIVPSKKSRNARVEVDDTVQTMDISSVETRVSPAKEEKQNAKKQTRLNAVSPLVVVDDILNPKRGRRGAVSKTLDQENEVAKSTISNKRGRRAAVPAFSQVDVIISHSKATSKKSLVSENADKEDVLPKSRRSVKRKITGAEPANESPKVSIKTSKTVLSEESPAKKKKTEKATEATPKTRKSKSVSKPENKKAAKETTARTTRASARTRK